MPIERRPLGAWSSCSRTSPPPSGRPSYTAPPKPPRRNPGSLRIRAPRGLTGARPVQVRRATCAAAVAARGAASGVGRASWRCARNRRRCGQRSGQHSGSERRASERAPSESPRPGTPRMTVRAPPRACARAVAASCGRTRGGRASGAPHGSTAYTSQVRVAGARRRSLMPSCCRCPRARAAASGRVPLPLGALPSSCLVLLHPRRCSSGVPPTPSLLGSTVAEALWGRYRPPPATAGAAGSRPGSSGGRLDSDAAVALWAASKPLRPLEVIFV